MFILFLRLEMVKAPVGAGVWARAAHAPPNPVSGVPRVHHFRGVLALRVAFVTRYLPFFLFYQSLHLTVSVPLFITGGLSEF